jgi:ATP-dependent DNA ligase
LRSGAWQKMPVNQGQEFVIAGYTPSLKNFDALIIGYCEGGRLIYAARIRSGFTPASGAELFRKIKPLEIKGVPLRESSREKGRALGRGFLRREDGGMSVAQAAARGAVRVRRMESEGHLRHSRLVGVREYEKAKNVGRER